MAGVVLQTTGLSPKAAALVAAIQAAVTTIIQQIQATPVAAITTAPSGANSFAGTVKPVSTKLSSGDKKKLKAIQAKIAVTQAQAAAWRAKHGK